MRVVLAWMARPWAPATAALIGIVLTLPAIGGGLLGDDYMHRSILLGVGEVAAGSSPAFDLFSFVPQGARREATLELGTLTWWAHPQLRVALLRPLSALTHMLDYRLWPSSLPLQHLHSLLWYGLAVFTVGAFYRRVHGATAVAGIAALLFAVEDAHAMNAGWLANRHALISLVVGMAALHAHCRWREGGGLAWALGGLALLAVALLCGEAALGAAAYIVAWQLTMEEGTLKNRLAALLPYGLIVVAWRAVYSALGYGTDGTALYVDPGRHPLAFTVALAERWPILQVSQWLQVPVDVFPLLSPGGQTAAGVISAAACLSLVWLFGPLLAERREARFWAIGMSLALVPLCAAFPMDRLLLFSGVGAFALLALLADRAGLLGSTVVSRPRARAGRALLLVHGPIAAVLLVVRLVTLPSLGLLFEAAALTAPADARAPQQTYVFVNGQEFPVVYLVIIRQLQDPPLAPRRVALLGSMLNENDVHREDADTLVITANGGFLNETIDRLLRSLDLPFRPGERIERRDFTAEIRKTTADGRPEQVAFRFRAPLESPEFRWLAWGEEGAEEFTLPPVGARVRLPATTLLRLAGISGDPRSR